MKKFYFVVAILTALALVLAACGGDDTAPAEINPDTDVCEVCGMAIADDQHATQIILKNDRFVKFDDLGDLYVWLDENGEDEVAEKFVRDFNTKEWILLEEASFVFSEEISTPMGFGVISFKDQKDAETYIDENGFGELLNAADLDQHEWDANHDHGDHDGHDDGDHEGHDDGDHNEHSFHTEGFDMHLTALENTVMGETTVLEVMLTLDDNALEDAMVRYEIWQADDKDNTDWIDAKEEEAGSYTADYVFEETGIYHIQIHVEDDQDLHEHMEYEVNIKE